MKKFVGVSHVWLTLVVIVGGVCAGYLVLSLSVSADPLLMPLDDTYIHFQYARQMAQGEPFVYNDGDPATSGGTSLLYPPLLALGYLLGFTGWALAYWALVLGIGFFLGSTLLVYLIARDNPLKPDQPDQVAYALWLAVAFALAGPLVWAALSGMETALFIFTVLLTLYAVQRDRWRLAIAAATLMTLTRPEGVLLAALAMATVALNARIWRQSMRRGLWFTVPVLASLLQPLINLIATGSAASSGMQAKSYLYNTGAPWEQRLLDILDAFGRIWWELFRGISPDWGMFTSWLMVQFALVTLVVGMIVAWRGRRLNVAVLMLAWMLALTAAVATLDTAFWQFKRYQLPVMALYFPAAAWGAALFGDRLVVLFDARWRWVRWVAPAIMLIAAALTALTFARYYRTNVMVVRDQQVKMAQWVRDNLPPDARVGVHDVGLVRYFGDRALYDVVGLTTPGPAESWRQGPGAIYEHMAQSVYRPDYFAIYPDVQGLSYLRDAGVFGEVLAEFPIEMPDHNVAAAADYQAVYMANWSATRALELVAQTSTLNYLAQLYGAELVDWIDVADLDSEAAHDYRWWQADQPAGFITEVYHHVYHACGLPVETDCWATDGGRVLTGGEEFTLSTVPGLDMLLITRVHGRVSVPLSVKANDELLTSRVQPAVPGRWVEVVTWIPADLITAETTRIRIESRVQSAEATYLPYTHWAYQGDLVIDMVDAQPIARFGGGIDLMDVVVTSLSDAVTLNVVWTGHDASADDGVVFIHLYNEGELNVEPVAQVITRPGDGVLPPANWLPGVRRDEFTLPLPDDLLPGKYVIALGLFDAQTGARYPVEGDDVNDNRLFVGEILIEERDR